ncbi:methionyl-tRNA formyltransferase, mitochondrial [Engraulis encrasicolus]|uniref:methionyl-tRNA formyltransferase, mitochondrial n=1 Tax=Engraulis encrasicolus TaxID=184585 RepID=UPI002FD62D5E
MWTFIYCNTLATGLRTLNSICISNHCKTLLTPWTRKVYYNKHQVQTSRHLASKPPWRVLFFGSDDFALESLKLLHASSLEANGRVVGTLEVVTLTHAAPVWKYAHRHQLRVHDWPDVDVQGRFDVGVVVSFGCLLKESLIKQLPLGILNVHPSLLPRWRGPAPVFHTVLHGDKLTGVSIMQIRPLRFDVGPILHQEVCEVPPRCTADELGHTLANVGARLLMDTLKSLPERISQRREQAREGASFAPKISVSMSWLVWEDQTCDQINRLYRAIGSRIPLRTMWMGRTVKLLDHVGKCNISLAGSPSSVPGSICFQKETNTLAVRCQDGWVGFKTVKLKKRLSAADFYNGYLHQNILAKSRMATECVFRSVRDGPSSAGTRTHTDTDTPRTTHTLLMSKTSH